MLTTDLALRFDPAYEAIARALPCEPGPVRHGLCRGLVQAHPPRHGSAQPPARARVPAEPRLWQDPVPTVDHALIDAADIAGLKTTILDSGLSIARLVATAWASASTFRGSDMRGGANGARIRLAPQKDWAVNESTELATALATLEGIQRDFNAAQAAKRVSLADLVVLGGAAAIEAAANAARHDLAVPFTPGRTDASDAPTDAQSFEPLEPKVDAFRNYIGGELIWSEEELLFDRAHMLTLTAPEMTVLIGGLRVLGANHGGSKHGVLTIGRKRSPTTSSSIC